jgi:hypothetical protein
MYLKYLISSPYRSTLDILSKLIKFIILLRDTNINTDVSNSESNVNTLTFQYEVNVSYIIYDPIIFMDRPLIIIKTK